MKQAWSSREAGMKRGAIVAVAVTAVLAGAVISAQNRDMTGYWELPVDGRNVPAAKLAPGVTQAVLDDVAERDARSIRWCLPLGMPFTMAGHGRPIDIRQGSRYIVIAAESPVAPARYVYFRGAHIGKDEYEPTTSGDSIARWDGDTLVVDTVGFSAVKGMLSIPGGGFRTEETRLTERYRLLKNGSVLSVTFTWEDPKVFQTPHTYEFRYQRLPSTYEPRAALPCDAFDAERIAFLEKR